MEQENELLQYKVNSTDKKYRVGLGARTVARSRSESCTAGYVLEVRQLYVIKDSVFEETCKNNSGFTGWSYFYEFYCLDSNNILNNLLEFYYLI